MLESCVFFFEVVSVADHLELARSELFLKVALDSLRMLLHLSILCV